MIDDPGQVALAGGAVPANEAVAGGGFPGGGTEAEQGQQEAVGGLDEVAQLGARQGCVAEVVIARAPHRIRMTQELRARFRNTVAEGFVPVEEAMRSLAVSRQTVWNRIKAGRLASQHVVRGPEKGLYVQLPERELPLLAGLDRDAEVAGRKEGAPGAPEGSGSERRGASERRGRPKAGETA